MFPLTRACAYAYTLVFAHLFPDVKRHTSAHMHIDVHVHRHTRPQITVHMYTHTFMHILCYNWYTHAEAMWATPLVFPSLHLSICIKAHIRMCAIDDADIDMRGLATSQLHCISTHMSYNPCDRTTLPAPPTLALSFFQAHHGSRCGKFLLWGCITCVCRWGVACRRVDRRNCCVCSGGKIIDVSVTCAHLNSHTNAHA